ncbi:Zn2 DNA-binding protein [Venustampulla echinocandica]|uniref:Zn2 DNA-binding protein n=1 Tax=Venustampulla echinocandica TaxID=2656787 RepID=A0A370TJW7_9HELO|nr:Zn2 DNA-binding protein [Venustampulla echinocandica]RDL35818.1 Zn2 DNA-binding protein [Venustampulla echinocandica]
MEMNLHPRSPPSRSSTKGGYPSKRARHTSPEQTITGTSTIGSPPTVEDVDTPGATASVIDGGSGGGSGTGKATVSSNFRNVSACNRCRLRKNRCDQQLPSCASCEKAGTRCVGYDPITKREIPRSYVFYLEARIGYLEKVLQDSNIPFAAADVLNHGVKPAPDPSIIQTPSDDGRRASYNGHDTSTISHKDSPHNIAGTKKEEESEKLDKLEKLISNVGGVSAQGASDSRYLGSASGISFARVVFAAVKSSVSGTGSDKSGTKPSRLPVSNKGTAAGGTSMRDSFFGLHTKPTIKQAPFPSKDLGRRLVEFYFEYANPQIPILHRGEFMKMFELAYTDVDSRVRTPRELYMLNIVFAIGSGIFLEDSGSRETKHEGNEERKNHGLGRQCQPEEYHASAIVHLEECLSSPATVDRPDGFGGGLEELQAVLLLAGFALLRPVAPGLWYIIGVAVRLAVDLGLHYEDGKDVDDGLEEGLSGDMKGDSSDSIQQQKERATRQRGRREWVRDFRRRLWWCTYSLDRLVSTCVGRPFGITDQVVTTEFPSLLDDKYITPAGFQQPPGGAAEPSYKRAAHHYFRLRLLQSEILQVLQHQQAQQARAGGANRRNPYMHTSLPSPFLSKFDSFRSWRIDIDKRLWEWKSSAPTKRETGVAFSVEFLELNYWQCVIMLYRQSLSVPPMFEGEFSTSDEVNSPPMYNVELREDQERVFLKVAEAGQRVLRLYRQLHRVHLVNYTFLATHHLFMAGISFLYAIWHSPIVRSRLTMDEVDFTILAATSVLGDLIEKCPPAEACRDAFDRMSKATVQMCMSTTGFSTSTRGLNSRERRPSHHQRPQPLDANGSQVRHPRPIPPFDMGLNDLLDPTLTSQKSAMQTPSSHFPATSQNNITKGIKAEFDPYSASATPSTTTSMMRQNINQAQSQSQSQSGPQTAMQSPSNYAVSPPLSSLDTSAIDPSLLPSPQSAYNNPSTSTDQYSYQDPQFPFPNAQGMDFLQGNGWDVPGADGNDETLNSWAGDLGMGLGWDGMDHDFSEGGNVDLFDGFFFGGAGTT